MQHQVQQRVVERGQPERWHERQRHGDGQLPHELRGGSKPGVGSRDLGQDIEGESHRSKESSAYFGLTLPYRGPKWANRHCIAMRPR